MYPEQGTAKEMGLVAPRLRRAHYPPLVPVMLKTRQILLFVATLCRFMCARLCVSAQYKALHTCKATGSQYDMLHIAH